MLAAFVGPEAGAVSGHDELHRLIARPWAAGWRSVAMAGCSPAPAGTGPCNCGIRPPAARWAYPSGLSMPATAWALSRSPPRLVAGQRRHRRDSALLERISVHKPIFGPMRRRRSTHAARMETIRCRRTAAERLLVSQQKTSTRTVAFNGPIGRAHYCTSSNPAMWRDSQTAPDDPPVPAGAECRLSERGMRVCCSRRSLRWRPRKLA